MFDATLYAICKKFTKDWVASHATLKKTIVEQLPDPQEADENTIYFVPVDPSDTTKGYDEYLVIDGQWELLTSATIEVDLNNIGFMVDENDDEMLIIDCKQHFTKVTTPDEFVEYIEKTLNVTIGSDTHKNKIKTWYEWYQNQSDTDKNNSYLMLQYKNVWGTSIYYAALIYANGEPVFQIEDGKYVLKCYVDGVQTPFGENEFWSLEISSSSSRQEYSQECSTVSKNNTMTYTYANVDQMIKYDFKQFNTLVIKEGSN